MSLAVPAFLCSVFCSVHTKLWTCYRFGLSLLLSLFLHSTWGILANLDIVWKCLVWNICMNSDFPVTGKEERGRSVVGSPVPVLFPELLALSMAENTLRTKCFLQQLCLPCCWRDTHASSGVAMHPPGSAPRTWGMGWGITVVLIFIWGSWSRVKKNVFYLVMGWVACTAISTLAVQRRSQEMLMLKHGAGAEITTLSTGGHTGIL